MNHCLSYLLSNSSSCRFVLVDLNLGRPLIVNRPTAAHIITFLQPHRGSALTSCFTRNPKSGSIRPLHSTTAVAPGPFATKCSRRSHQGTNRHDYSRSGRSSAHTYYSDFLICQHPQYLSLKSCILLQNMALRILIRCMDDFIAYRINDILHEKSGKGECFRRRKTGVDRTCRRGKR